MELRPSYQTILRELGAFFDEHGATSISVVEEQDGYWVRWLRPGNPPEMAASRLSAGDLEALQSNLEWHRSGRGPRDPRGPYQDFLRALGHELEEAEAWQIVIDEVGHDITVTYLQLDPAHTVHFRKRINALGIEDRHAVMESAYHRRRAKPGLEALLNGMLQTPRASSAHGASLPDLAPAAWEAGEREVYRSEINGALAPTAGNYGEMLLTNRRVLLRGSDGSIQRVGLRVGSAVRTDVRRDLLTRHHRVEIVADGGVYLALDCLNDDHMADVARRVQEVVAGLPA